LAFTRGGYSDKRRPLRVLPTDVKKPRLGGVFSLRPEGSVRLHRLDVSCLLALRARLHFKRNLLVFLQRLEAFRADFREMREQIFTAAVGSDEAEALCVIEPLDGTGVMGPTGVPLMGELRKTNSLAA
jgi:hypothetical protein